MGDEGQTTGRLMIDDVLSKIARYEARLAVSNAKTKTAIIAALAAAGVARVTVIFDGYGDSGGIEDVAVEGALTELPAIEVSCWQAAYGDGEAETEVAKPLKDAVEDLALAYLSQTHGGWENNEGAFGEVVIDVESGTATLDYHERLSRTDDYSYTF